MNQHSTIFRAATPTFEDGLAFANYLDQAAEGFFRFMLGRHSEEIIAKAFMQPRHDLSYQNVTFAERDKAIVGMASGYTAEQHRRYSKKPLKQAAGRQSLRMMLVSILFAPLLRSLETIADGDFYLLAIAVDKQLRGEGVGSALIDLIENKAIASGSARLALDVTANNKNARRLYEFRGMVAESQWPKHISIPGIKIFRIAKKL